MGVAFRRAAYAAGLAEERTRRALRDARERLSATSFDRQPTASTNTTSPQLSIRWSKTNHPRSLLPPHPHQPPSSSTTTHPAHLRSPTISSSSARPARAKRCSSEPSHRRSTFPLSTLTLRCSPMAGYVGEDVESIIQRLLVEAGWDVERAQRGLCVSMKWINCARSAEERAGGECREGCGEAKECSRRC